MPYVTIIPALVCIVTLFRSGTRSAFLNVFLPVLLLFPTNFYLEITHLPNLNFVDLVLASLGLGMLFTDVQRWRFTTMDLIVLAFVFSYGYSEWTIYHYWRLSALGVLEGLVPYAAGKLLLEEPLTSEVAAKRFITFVGAASLIGMYEYLFKSNPYKYFWSHFYPGQWGGSVTQIRWGFGRMSGPYVQSELAGMVIMTAVLLAFWLVRWRNWRKVPDLRNAPGAIKLGVPLLAFVALALFMTQARGPWIGCIVALGLAWVGKARNPARRGLIFLALCIGVGIPIFQFAQSYTSGPRTDYGSERETAQYRAELIDNYIPLAQSGGAWGLSRELPIIQGQTSIDNEYLFVWLVQGYVGALSFLAILVGTAITLLRFGVSASAPEQRHLGFTLLGILIGMAFTLSTVWLGGPSIEVFFLIVGWSQAVRPASILQAVRDSERVASPVLREALAFRVYT